MESIDLGGKWQFRAADGTEAIPRGVGGILRWMNGTVPGTVHTDLLAAGKIPDPFYRMNENDVQWIDRVGWIYRRTFLLPDSILREPSVELVAEGLDTFAEIRINDHPVARTANMFIEHRFPVKELLRPGENVLEILFDSPTLRAMALEKEHGRLQVALQPHRVHARKAQYSFGWDWGPTLTTSGIWRPIRIEAFGERLRDPFVKVVSMTPTDAEIEIEVAVDGWERGGLNLDIAIESVEDGRSAPSAATARPVDGGRMKVRVPLPDPRIWWPNGYGRQPLYHARMVLRRGNEVRHELVTPFAVRRVRLLQESDAEGKSFIFEINGVRIFCKGADWIPADSFLPRVEDGTYRRLLAMARDASMNMIRIWGGGVYEREIFYDECDRLGLMVWQDFMYACGEYPDHRSFLDEARREAEAVVRRLRNHPSLVLWCGNNECEWIFCSANPGKGPDEMRGAAIFKRVLREVTEELDGTRPYWRSTPFGDGFPNSESTGNHHQWEVWSMWQDYGKYRNDRARFVSEFGFQAPAHPRTMESVLEPRDLQPQSEAMEHHNKQVEGTERLIRFMAGHYALPGTWEEFLYTGQLLQAEALKCAVEHWRRRKFRTAGALFWQLNDCWPVTSWSVIDSALRPKAAYYAARRFFAPVLVSFAPAEEGVEVWGTNDLLVLQEAQLDLRLCTFEGKTLAKTTLCVRMPANSSEKLHLVPPGWKERGGDYLRALFRDGRRTVAVNRFLLREPKHSDFPSPRIGLRLAKIGPGSYRAALTSNVFALGVVVSSSREGVYFHDNFVDLDPGVEHEIQITTRLSSPVLRRSLTTHALNSSSGIMRGKS